VEGVAAIVTATGGITLDGLTVKATTAGEATVTATVGSKTVTVTITVEQSVKDKIAATLKGDQIANFNTADYAALFSAATINQHNKNGFKPMTFIGVPHNCYEYSDVNYGTAVKIDFPEEKTYNEGYLVLKLSFNNERQAQNIKIYVYSYDETDGSKGVELSKFIVEEHKVYVPMSAIVDENNLLKGIQIAWDGWGGKAYLRGIEYSPSIYAIEENISAGEYEVGNTYDVTYGATKDGVSIEDATVTCTIADSSVLTIADGKLTALKAGTTKVTLIYMVSGVRFAVKYFNVTVANSYIEEIKAGLGENELANFKSVEYLKTLSNMTVNNASYNPGPLTITPTIVTKNGESYLKYTTLSGNNNGGLTVTFVKQNKYEGDQLNGYLKVRVYFDNPNGYRAMYFFKHGETTATIALTVSNSEIKGAGAVDLYIPIKNLVDGDGILKGIQFATRYFGTSNVYVGAMTYVTEKPAA
jgi:hypothetical protein